VKRIKLRIAMLLCLIATTAIAQSDTTSERRFTLPDHGKLVIHVTRDWKDRVRQPPDRLPPTITLGPASGKAFQVLLTPTWPATSDRPPQSRDDLRAAVEQAARDAKAQAVEKELPIVEFQGTSGSGFYFSATDRAPKRGEYKFVTQGAIGVGELTVSFTILTNEGQKLVVEQALDALRGATHGGI